MKRTTLIMLGASICLTAMYAAGWPSVNDLIDFATADGGVNSDGFDGFDFDATNAYFQMGSDNPQIVKIYDIDGLQIRTQLVSSADWIALTGEAKMGSGKGFAISGDYLQFGDSFSDQIYRVNRFSGLLAVYISKASIKSFTGQAGVRMLAAQTTHPLSGEQVFYEGYTDTIFITAGTNQIAVLASETELTNAFGTADVTGMTYTPDGTLYFAGYLKTIESGNTSWYYAVQMLLTNGQFATALTTEQVAAVADPDAHIIGDMHYAQDGRIYFKTGSTTEGGILRFDPADPGATLEEYISKEAMEASIAGSAYALVLGWCHGGLVWNHHNQESLFRGTPVVNTHYADAGNTSGAAWPYTNAATAAVSLQNALDAADGGDTIIAADGNYCTGGRVTPGYALSNRLLITRPVIITSSNGPDAAVICGEADMSGDWLHNGIHAVRGIFCATNAVLTGFTITNGHTFGRYDGEYPWERGGGGAVLQTGGVISNCAFISNHADYWGGGGVVCLAGGMINNCRFRENKARGSGGGVYYLGMDETEGMFNCSFEENVVSNYNGGGIYCAQAGIISNCLLYGNISIKGSGGGIYLYRGDCETVFCSAISNSAGMHAGGIGVNSLASNNTRVNYCRIQYNSITGTGYAGGLRLVSAEAHNCLVSGNHSDVHGGGVYCYRSVMNNCTITDNSCGEKGGGIYLLQDSSLRNCIIYHNTADEDNPNWYNDPGDSGMHYINSCTYPDPAGTACSTNDPDFVAVEAGNYHLTMSSPCLNAGSNAFASGEIDLDGNPRISLGTVDMGVYELIPEPGSMLLVFLLLSIAIRPKLYLER